MLFMFNSLDERVDVNNHPKYHIIINNVSKHGDVYDIEKIEKDPTNASASTSSSLSVGKRIDDFKTQLKEGAKAFNLGGFVSDSTIIGSKAWKEIKEEVCQGEAYQEETWYKELTDHEKTLVSDLRQIQLEIGLEKPIEPMENYIRAKFIETRIDELLPSKNFFFYKIFTGDSEEVQRRNAIEKRELDRLIETHQGYDRYYIEQGQIEP